MRESFLNRRPLPSSAYLRCLCTALILATATSNTPAQAAPTYWAQQSGVLPSSTLAQIAYGTTFALSGTTMVLGTYAVDTAYIYTRSGNRWFEEARLTPSDTVGLGFGATVALSGDTAVFGAPYADPKGSDSGAAYVYVRSGTSWTRQATLVPSDGASKEQFGSAVALNGNTAIVAAQFHSGAAPSGGAVYVFTRSGTTWTQTQKLVAPDAATNTYLGNGAAMTADTAVITAPGQIAAYVFVKGATSWSFQQKLTVPMASIGYGLLNAPVAVDQSSILLGSGSGSAYVFVRNGTTWTMQQRLVSNDFVTGDRFAEAGVALSGDTAVVGAYGASAGASKSGAAYVFQRSGTTWTQVQKLAANFPISDAGFGKGAAASLDTILIGAPHNMYPQAYYFSQAATLANGQYCSEGAWCASTFCSDKVCCNEACGSGAGDCQACSRSAGAAIDGTCSTVAAGSLTCRPVAGECDVVEMCGGSAACPSNGFKADGTKCSVGTCQAGGCRTETDLGITLTTPEQPIDRSTPLTVPVLVRNASPQPADQATLTFTLSNGATFSRAGGTGWTCQADGATATCSSTKVAASGSFDLSLTVILPPAAGSCQLQAQLRSTTYDQNAADNDSVAVISVLGASTCTEVTCPPGTPGAPGTPEGPGTPAMATGCTTTSGATGTAPWTALFVTGACLLLLRRRARSLA